RRRTLEVWVTERRADARVLALTPAVAQLVSGWPPPRKGAPADPDASHDVGYILSNAAQAYGYRGLWLIACGGAVLAKSAAAPPLAEAASADARRACDGTGEVV